MALIKVALDSGPLNSGYAFRGIGVMVREQIEAIKEFGSRSIKLDTFDFNSESGKLKLETGKYDIIHYTTFFPALTLPDKKLSQKVVVTIQDLIHLIYPDKYPPGVRGKMNLWKQKIRLKLVDAVITISETSKKDIVRLLGIPQNKVHVVYLAPDKNYKVIKDNNNLKSISRKYKLPSRFVFYLGDVNYNKNIPTLIKACEIAKTPLVLAGKQAAEIEDMGLVSLMNLSGPKDWIRFLLDIPHPEHAHYQEMLDKFKENKNIYRLGFVPNEDIAEIFNLASVYVQPSFYEGFGLSVIHAFACRIPVVVSKTNALVEIVGGAALVADPNDPKDMAKKITEVLKNGRTREGLVKKGFERVKYFNWEKMAKGMIEVYKSLA